MGRRLHHRCGTAVVDLERTRVRAGEQVVVVDQVCGIGSGIPVDRLVVVADAEHIELR